MSLNAPLAPDLLVRYLDRPLDYDADVRKVAEVPDDAYYTVSVWPTPGWVRVERRGSRTVARAKISKSSQ